MNVFVNENPPKEPIASEWGKYLWEKSDCFLNCSELELCIRYNQTILSPPYLLYEFRHGSHSRFSNNFYKLREEFYRIVNLNISV